MAKRSQEAPADDTHKHEGPPAIEPSLSESPAVTAGEPNSSQSANQNVRLALTRASIPADPDRDALQPDVYSALGLGPPRLPTTGTTTNAPPLNSPSVAEPAPAPTPATGPAAGPVAGTAAQISVIAAGPGSPAPAGAAASPLTRTRSGTRAAKATDATLESPSAGRAKKSKAAASTAKATDPPLRATKPAQSAPNADAIQAGLDSAGNRLTADEARIAALETTLNSHTARSKVQHDVTSKQLSAINKETAAAKLKHEIAARQLSSIEKDLSAVRRQQDTSRTDMDRLIDKMRNLDNWMRESRELAGSSGLSAFAPDFMDTMDSAMAAARAQIQEGLDAIAVLRERVDAQDAKVIEATDVADEAQNSANLALEHTHHLARRLERHIDSAPPAAPPVSGPSRDAARPAGASAASDAERMLIDAVSNGLPPPPPPPPPTLRRKSYATESESEDDGRTRKAARLIYDYDTRAREPTFEGYHSYGHRRSQVDRDFASIAHEPAQPSRAATSAPPPTPSSDEFPPTYVSARVGSDSSEQSIAWGRRNDPPAMIARVTRWTLFMDPTGAIPVPVAAAAPPGMADNYRLITFHNNNDLVRFLAAWQNRPEALRRINATPVPEIASAVTAPSSASLGLHPPGAGGSGGRRPSGSKDSRGNRPF
ncbi:hypothetical protein AURDEDRAFT_164911 [Auricularia subglabra TFB-10046 SS5]|nr:hypothetical protein AURDEDRAFT_164911 [Auricularia subglabra TFB-10046 SS5]